MFKRFKWLILIAALGVLMHFALSEELAVRTYVVASDRICGDMCLCVVSDLHNCFYGENQEALISAIDGESPDAVLVLGDVCSGLADFGGIQALIQGLDGRYPVYYVSGNHENDDGQLEQIKAALVGMGVNVLEGGSEILDNGACRVRISGLDDPISLTRTEWSDRLDALRAEAADDTFTILMSHRPDRVDRYDGFDLILCGHAHGGQVRIPGILNGLWAPNQGWFPKYAGGEYALESGRMIVSRGLEKNNLPRVFNRPELVVVRLKAEEG